jgi:hypothetical protein
MLKNLNLKRKMNEKRISEEDDKSFHKRIIEIQSGEELEDFEKLRIAKYILANQNIVFTQQKLPRIKTFDFETTFRKNSEKDLYKKTSHLMIKMNSTNTKNINEGNQKKKNKVQVERDFVKENKMLWRDFNSEIYDGKKFKSNEAIKKENIIIKDQSVNLRNRVENNLNDFSEEILFEADKLFKEQKDLIFLRFFASEENIRLKKFEDKLYLVVNFLNKIEKNAFSGFVNKNFRKMYEKYFYQKNRHEDKFVFSTNLFQSNLWKVIQKPNHFNLYLSPDTNSDQIGHWFLFEFTSYNYSKKTIFKIKNFSNPHENLENLELCLSYACIDLNVYGANSSNKINFQKNLLVKSIKKKANNSYCLEFEFPITKNKMYIFSFDKPLEKKKIASLLSPNKLNSKHKDSPV